MENWRFLTDDWKKIPQNTRYFFFAGIFCIALTWLIDHWGRTCVVYTWWGLDIRSVSFSLGITILILNFVALLWRQAVYWAKAEQLKRKFPIAEVGSKFHLGWFNGKLILFDIETKKFHHIYPLETAQDLLFADTGTHFTLSLDMVGPTITFDNGKNINLSDYTDGGPINSRL